MSQERSQVVVIHEALTMYQKAEHYLQNHVELLSRARISEETAVANAFEIGNYLGQEQLLCAMWAVRPKWWYERLALWLLTGWHLRALRDVRAAIDETVRKRVPLLPLS